MSNLKRLRDTEHKKIVWAIPEDEPYKKLQVWTNDDWSKLYVYRNSQYLELDTSNSTVAEYWHYWKQLNDEMVWYYLTPEPTNLFNWDEWDEASYQFVDWDWTVLKSWKVDEGETPTPPADPTREATAQYTYTFAWWNPTVWPINKKTIFTATYTAVVNEYTVTISVNEDDYWYTEPATITNVPYWTSIWVDENDLLHVWTVTVTPHANTGYTFSSWWDLPASVTWATSITATFEPQEYTISIESEDTAKWTVDTESISAAYWDAISASDNVLTIWETEITATAETWYVFSSWTDSVWESLPATVSWVLSIVAKFAEDQL